MISKINSSLGNQLGAFKASIRVILFMLASSNCKRFYEQSTSHHNCGPWNQKIGWNDQVVHFQAQNILEILVHQMVLSNYLCFMLQVVVRICMTQLRIKGVPNQTRKLHVINFLQMIKPLLRLVVYGPRMAKLFSVNFFIWEVSNHCQTWARSEFVGLLEKTTAVI